MESINDDISGREDISRNRLDRYGTGRNSTGRNSTGRNSTGRNDAYRNGTGRNIMDQNDTVRKASTELFDDNCPISVHITANRTSRPSYENKQIKSRHLITIKRSNKLLEASYLPVVVSLNPRGLYNKQNEFRTLIEQTEATVCCVSETWDRSHTGGALISDLIEIEGFTWIKNIVQRKRKGGKPAILVSKKDHYITQLCPDIITVPINVEAVWTLLTPKHRSTNTRIKHIAVCSAYYSSTQTRKADFLDHISQSYHLLCSKYGSDLKFLIVGDLNRLNIKPILSLSSDLQQVVKVPTRLNPDAILDVIITNIHHLYQPPTTLAPLDNDENQTGKPADHLVVVMKPLSTDVPNQIKRYKTIKYRPFPDSAIREMGQWVQGQTWKEVYDISCPSKKAEKFEKLILEKVDQLFPQKSIKLSIDDKPWVDLHLLNLDRKCKREYNKNKKSKKWEALRQEFLERSLHLKELYYINMVEDLKNSNVSQWYSKVKRMSEIDPTSEEKVQVQELVNQPSQTQAELIANKFSEISNLYQPLKPEEVKIPNKDDSKMAPLFEPYEIHEKIRKMKKKASSVLGDILREFSVELSYPLSNIYNSSTLAGVWPALWKHEFVTPVPKVFPPNTRDDLRKITGTKNLSKIYESLLSDSIIGDMAPNIDPSQFGNEKGLNIQHYLVKFVNQILTILDTNNEKEKYAVLATLVDWSKAFDRIDHTLGIKSFVENGVRPSLIPVLSSYFQNRTMTVKWHGHTSTTRDLPGGGPQGCTLGLIEYKSSSNKNAEHIPPNRKFKFVDDLSFMEKLNLILIGLTSYNFKRHVASDVGIDQNYLPSENIKSQNYLQKIQDWTASNKSKLNVEKSKVMIFNFTENFQFSTRLFLENSLLEIINETKLLGTIISSDLKWHKNTEMIVKKGFQRMIILQKLAKFKVNPRDLVTIYILYIRSILEQSCVVWHFDITQEEISDLERVQKVALKVILQEDYESYHQALRILNLEPLFVRRKKLCLRFAKKCVKHEKSKTLFPINNNERNKDKYEVQFARTSRLMFSSIPQLQRLLNEDAKK